MKESRSQRGDLMPDSPQFLTLREAARDWTASLSTLQRHRREGDLESLGAHKDTRGAWKIPPTALAALGYTPVSGTGPDTSDVTPPDTTPEHTPEPKHTQLNTLRDELAATRERLARLEAENEGHRALLAERERTVETQAQALRMLTTGSTATPPDTGLTTPIVAPADTASDTPVTTPTTHAHDAPSPRRGGGLLSRLLRRPR
ncbi:hypothetical protein GCM10023165_37620 [Variovorax defluvii]|uniref:DNA-binding protein n=1 Tax=Variovorax defluvii TaxID=913761 RepID=A0ABP8I311_9BURK